MPTKEQLEFEEKLGKGLLKCFIGVFGLLSVIGLLDFILFSKKTSIGTPIVQAKAEEIDLTEINNKLDIIIEKLDSLEKRKLLR